AETPGPETQESSEDEPAFEPLVGDVIDIGEAVAQEFSLALPSFPRSPGAALEIEGTPPDGGPFAALSRLADRQESSGSRRHSALCLSRVRPPRQYCCRYPRFCLSTPLSRAASHELPMAVPKKKVSPSRR